MVFTPRISKEADMLRLAWTLMEPVFIAGEKASCYSFQARRYGFLWEHLGVSGWVTSGRDIVLNTKPPKRVVTARGDNEFKSANYDGTVSLFVEGIHTAMDDLAILTRIGQGMNKRLVVAPVLVRNLKGPSTPLMNRLGDFLRDNANLMRIHNKTSEGNSLRVCGSLHGWITHKQPGAGMATVCGFRDIPKLDRRTAQVEKWFEQTMLDIRYGARAELVVVGHSVQANWHRDQYKVLESRIKPFDPGFQLPLGPQPSAVDPRLGLLGPAPPPFGPGFWIRDLADHYITQPTSLGGYGLGIFIRKPNENAVAVMKKHGDCEVVEIDVDKHRHTLEPLVPLFDALHASFHRLAYGDQANLQPEMQAPSQLSQSMSRLVTNDTQKGKKLWIAIKRR